MAGIPIFDLTILSTLFGTHIFPLMAEAFMLVWIGMVMWKPE